MATLEVLAQDRAGLLRDVMQVVAEAGKSALGSETRILGPIARIRLRLIVQDGERESLVQAIKSVKSVQEVRWV
ncbi:guanosine-3',5'-bis [Thermus scotoductus]|uniref:Guanosine-3',5'-bis n=1 Tax=Thermus scotoductus TaxID=37636 RepID=A0A430SAM9_THESC|nr:guanosine-3',5'-bis [Thermus scotoductus]RTH11024.1 guanosine-3',5'-bis [Thermus scotoductus]RTH27757.1 guanosine-3',5'-bis [Thermus scotoductus]RTH33043.1 guanosine-3',5'-bis [Thermus scotoductus]RTH39470.1 guanosine-3',5'-bis [Thermus scotoductus]